MKPILMFAATAALAFVLYFAFFGRQTAHDSDGTSALATPQSEAVRPQPPIEAPAHGSSSANDASARLEGSGATANERTAAEPHPFLTALPPPAPVVEGDARANDGTPAYSEPTELLHFALRNSQDVFEAKYREQGKDEFTANLRSLEGVLAAQRSGKLQDRAQILDAKELEILEERVKWMRAFARRL